MIGPGTGVTPFRGFLQQRRAALAATNATDTAECWLFFGCRDKSKDYLYGDELDAFAKDGTLTKICVAESRKDPGTKVYVQDLMRQHSRRLRELIVDQDAFIFVCGDGHGMAKDVHGALVDIIRSGNDVDAKEADDMLAGMTREARYVKDVWS
jgi:sulfite reductase alpha subunit-like flavoprotein